MRRILERLESKDLSDRDLARFVEVCGKYGPGTKIEFSGEIYRSFLIELYARVGETVTVEMIREIVDEVKGWEAHLEQERLFGDAKMGSLELEMP